MSACSPLAYIILRLVGMSLLLDLLGLFTVKVEARFRISLAQWKFCLTVFFIHPEEDRQGGRNIDIVFNCVLSIVS